MGPIFPTRYVAALCLIAATGITAARAATIRIGRRISHPDGVSITLNSIDLAADAIVLDARIANPTNREIWLDRRHSFILNDGAHGVYHLNPPLDNPDLAIPAHTTLSGELVFIGPLAPAARQIAISTNEGIGTADNPYDDSPIFHATLPIEPPDAAQVVAQAGHPDGVTLRISRLAAGAAGCEASVQATNGNERTIVLNQNRSLALSDAHGVTATVRAPADNAELVVPAGDRLDAELVFDCARLDRADELTLSINRGTAGTTDNPYETLPVFVFRLRARQTAPGSPAPLGSRAAVSPIRRSVLATAAVAAAANPSVGEAGSPPRTATSPAVDAPPLPTVKETGATSPPGPVLSKVGPPRSVAQLEAALRARRTGHGLRIVLPADTLFGAASHGLGAAADPLLANLAELIVTTQPRHVTVTGHTDSVGNDDANLLLSEQRARAVAAWLEAHLPKHRPRFAEKGYGRTRPLAPNHNADGSDNPAGRGQNRRIEVSLSR